MKTIIYSVIILCGMLLPSCNFLDREPETFWSGNTFPQTESHLKGILYGGYENIQVALGANFLMYGDVRGDLFELNNPNALAAEQALTNSLNADMGLASWGSFYEIVQQANLLLTYAPKLQESKVVTSATANSVMGQAYCMRAMAYFWIVRIWGDAPLILEPFRDGTGPFNFTKTPSATILASIHQDLDNAKALLAISATRTTFSGGAAYALDAQVYAWENNWYKVAETTNVILRSTVEKPINSSVYSLAKLFDPTLDTFSIEFITTQLQKLEYVKMFNSGNSSESIFELAYNAADMENNNSLFSYMADSYQQLNTRIEFSGGLNGADWRSFVLFPDGDQRMRKFFHGYDKTNSARNIVMLRLSDVALLKAEAMINLKDTEVDEIVRDSMFTQSMALINAIRTRAGGPSMGISAESYENMSLDQLKEVIAQERKSEFAGEGYRYFDLIRTGKVLEVMEPINGQNDVNSLIWPIAMTEIRNSNGVIEQNTYYK